MSYDKCLYCYKPLFDGEVDYHNSCARKIFESSVAPTLPYTRDNIKELARKIVFCEHCCDRCSGKAVARHYPRRKK